jgi:hypothetical protein
MLSLPVPDFVLLLAIGKPIFVPSLDARFLKASIAVDKTRVMESTR